MRKLILLACLSLVSFSAMASCENLKAKIDSKLQAKGVKSYTLKIVPATKPDAVAPASGSASPAAGEGKVVGTCEGGSKQIVYKRN